MTPGPFAALIDDDLGVVTAQPDGRYTVVFERRLKKPIGKVWAALTVAERIADWFTPVDIDLRVGGVYRIRFDGMDAIEGKIVEMEPPRRLVHTWPDSTDPNGPDSLISYILEPDGDGCRLQFSQTNLPKMYLGAVAGWHTFFEALPGAAEGIRTPWSQARETEMGERYKAIMEALG